MPSANSIQTYDAYNQRVVEKKSWNSLLIQLHRLSRVRLTIISKKEPGTFAKQFTNINPAQSQSILVTSFFDSLSTENALSGPTKEVLWYLYRLFALHTIENDGYECEHWNLSPLFTCYGVLEILIFSLNISYLSLTRNAVFRCNAVSQRCLEKIPRRVQELMARIRPHAVALVDSWMIPDYLLDR